MKQKDLRDEIAMSLPEKFIPTIENNEAVGIMKKFLGFTEPFKDDIELIEFGFIYQAKMRYMYADAMLKIREESST